MFELPQANLITNGTKIAYENTIKMMIIGTTGANLMRKKHSAWMLNFTLSILTNQSYLFQSRVIWYFESASKDVAAPVKQNLNKMGALVWWLWDETHVPKVVGSDPRPHTGWTFLHLFGVQIIMFV